MVTWEPPSHFTADYIDAVSLGIGRFADTAMRKIVIDEAFHVVSAARWYTRATPSLTNYREFADLYQNPAERLYDCSAYICIYLVYAFSGTHKLSELFTFTGDHPEWADSQAQLVRLSRDADGGIQKALVQPSDISSGPTLGSKARTAEDVISWLKVTYDTVFCLCPASCGADLIFALKLSNGQCIWVVLRTSGNGSSTELSQTQLEESFESILPSNFFSSVRASLIHNDNMMFIAL